jgi:hypothetical protein
VSERTDLERELAEEDELRALVRSDERNLLPPPYAAVELRARRQRYAGVVGTAGDRGRGRDGRRAHRRNGDLAQQRAGNGNGFSAGGDPICHREPSGRPAGRYVASP